MKKAKEGDVDAVNAIFGTFACQASNIAGQGEKCSISIDGPPSALVADTDTTYLIFGGVSVLLLLFIIVTSIILCRRHSVSKYPATTATNTTVNTASSGINRVPEQTTSNTDLNTVKKSNGSTAAFSATSAQQIQQQQSLHRNNNGMSMTSFRPMNR